jgi:DNA polymerase-3 subunit delta'
MSAETGLSDLDTKLCPWLGDGLERLERAIAAGRLAHGWLLAGPRGIGKINLALVLARRILDPGLRGVAPAELPPAMAAAAMRRRHEPSDHHPDLHWIYPEDDKHTISVEQIRAVTAQVGLTAYRGAAKVVIIEPAEAMTTSAANALLKTLEEPTADTYLLLVSHQPGRLMATIRSRCQTLVLAGPQPAAGARWLGDAAAEAGLAAGVTPLQLAADRDDAISQELNKLEDTINLISEERLDPQVVADRWLKMDLDSLLGALARCTARVVRGRFAAKDSNPVTDLPAGALHNAWPALTLRTLFEQLQTTWRLQDEIGRGTNMDLAVRVLLMGFKPVRGTT